MQSALIPIFSRDIAHERAAMQAAARMPLPANVDFDEQGRPFRVTGTDVYSLTPLVEQAVQAARNIYGNPQDFIAGKRR
jgi:hypothetical protein